MSNSAKILSSGKLVVPLQAVISQDIELAGGKGANLGELIQAGFPVPSGFVVTTEAYTCFLTDNHLLGAITAGLVKGADSAAIRVSFENAPMPEEIKQAILNAFHELGHGAVAVRSSATAEDLPQATFAGQQDTYLNISGDEQLLQAVRRCWGSLWSERAIAYRARQEIDQQTVKLAVVVQKMVNAKSAGVLFTANPVTGARNEIVIDSNPGLGEAVVSGLVTPDHFVLQENKHGRLKITQRHPGRREIMIEADPGGGTRQIKGDSTNPDLAPTDRKLIELAVTGRKIERHFGRPQDIEWAMSGGQLYILQARPMTALPEPLPPSNQLIRMLASMFAEMFPVRPYPLDQTTWVGAISAAAVDPLFGLLGLSVPSIQRLFLEEDGVVVRFSGQLKVRPKLAVILAPARLLLFSMRYDPLQFQSDPLLIDARNQAAFLAAMDVQALSWTELLDATEKTLRLALPLAGEMRRRYYPRALLAMAILRVTLGALGLGKLFGALIIAPESATTQANQALEELAAQVRSNPKLADRFQKSPPDQLLDILSRTPEGQQFLSDFQNFLDCFGHREVVLSSVLQPTWKDSPEVVLELIRGLSQAEVQVDNREKSWEAARNQLIRHPLMRIRWMQRWMMKMVASARSLWQIREDTHFEATRIMPILRRIFLELGERLVRIGVCSTAQEVFHLTLSDLQRVNGTWPPNQETAAELRNLIELRKQKRLALEAVPIIDPRLYQPANPNREALLSGMPGSPGIVEGPVRVIHSANEFSRLQPGEILVAPYTNPAWTPLFQRAAAVVVDGGSTGSHAAIVAREYGIPAVMGTIMGTQKLVDGQRIRVDGSRGFVYAAEDKS